MPDRVRFFAPRTRSGSNLTRNTYRKIIPTNRPLGRDRPTSRNQAGGEERDRPAQISLPGDIANSDNRHYVWALWRKFFCIAPGGARDALPVARIRKGMQKGRFRHNSVSYVYTCKSEGLDLELRKQCAGYELHITIRDKASMQGIQSGQDLINIPAAMNVEFWVINNETTIHFRNAYSQQYAGRGLLRFVCRKVCRVFQRDLSVRVRFEGDSISDDARAILEGWENQGIALAMNPGWRVLRARL